MGNCHHKQATFFCIFFVMVVFSLTSFALASSPEPKAYPSLQSYIDKAQPHDVIAPPPGIYAGNLNINKPITLDGKGKVILNGDGKSTVIFLNTNGAVLQNLHITNSGDLHNELDSGIQVRGNNNVIKDNIIENVLFGIDLGESNNNIIRRNKIVSKPFDIGVRGDAIRLWYSKGNKITHNKISGARDFVIWYSENNIINNNDISGGRYGLHFMYSLHNKVENNKISNNNVGIFLMYSDGVEIRNNVISNSVGAHGMGIGFKETSDVIVEGNDIIYCARGIYSDVSPYQPDTKNFIISNNLAFNGIGLQFHNDWHSNVIRNNNFASNYRHVAVSGFQTAKRNDWSGNFWDNYQGFDKNNDNIGDYPYIERTYSDRIWLDVPYAAFFKGSPMLSLLDFLERLAPFTEPLLLLQDDSPKTLANGAPVVDITIKKIQKPEEEESQPELLKLDPFGLNG